MAEALSSPLFIAWEVTNGCNLRCKTCYNASSGATPAEINSDEVDAVIDKIIECRPIFVDIGGGEPFTRPDLEKIVEKLSAGKIAVRLTTNGTICNKELLLRLQKWGVNAIQVSIDGFEDAHDAIRGAGTFKKAVDTLKFLIENGFDTSISVVITALNWRDLDHYVKYFLQLGVKKVGAFRFVPSGRGGENKYLQLGAAETKLLTEILEGLETELGDRYFKCDHSLAAFSGVERGGGCELGLKCLSIKPDGRVCGCPFLPLALGNVRDSSLLDIWKNSEVLKKMREDARVENLSGKCVECPSEIKNVCRGGCKAMAYEATGSLTMPDPRCWR